MGDVAEVEFIAIGFPLEWRTGLGKVVGVWV